MTFRSGMAGSVSGPLGLGSPLGRYETAGSGHGKKSAHCLSLQVDTLNSQDELSFLSRKSFLVGGGQLL